MELEILGSGTSHGIPVIGCSCPVCTSDDPKDNRMRASALLRGDNGESILIDAGPEFRVEALRAHIRSIDAVLVTHAHADHIHGLDDIRIFTANRNMPVYANAGCIADIAERFAYIFKQTQIGGGKPHLELNPVSGLFTTAGITIVPIPVFHGTLPILGWRIGDTAYITDCNGIPESSLDLLFGVTKLVLGALRLRPHPTHFNFPQALEQIERIGPEQTWLTHICHDFSHAQILEWFHRNAPGKKIEPAYDGLRITIRQ